MTQSVASKSWSEIPVIPKSAPSFSSPLLCLSSALADQPPELRLVEERDAVTFFAETFDLHQFESGVAPGGLENIWPAAHDNAGLCRRPAMDDGAGLPGGARGFRACSRQNTRERDVHTFQRS